MMLKETCMKDNRTGLILPKTDPDKLRAEAKRFVDKLKETDDYTRILKYKRRGAVLEIVDNSMLLNFLCVISYFALVAIFANIFMGSISPLHSAVLMILCFFPILLEIIAVIYGCLLYQKVKVYMESIEEQLNEHLINVHGYFDPRKDLDIIDKIYDWNLLSDVQYVTQIKDNNVYIHLCKQGEIKDSLCIEDVSSEEYSKLLENRDCLDFTFLDEYIFNRL